MTKFLYKARDTEGRLVEGVVQANSSRDVVSALHDKGLVAVSVDEVKETAAKKKKKIKISLKKGRIRSKDIAIFCRQMATMINAGVSVMESMEDIAQMSLNIKFRNILKTIANDIKAGNSLSEALKKHPKVYSKVFVAMVRAGEESGHLDTIMNDLASYLEAAVKLQRKVKAASMYPIFVAGFFVVTLLGLVFFLMPRFKKLFTSLGAELPVPTKIVMAVSEAIIKNFPIFLLIVVALGVSFTMIYKTKAGRYRVDSFIIKMPILGLFTTKVILTRFFQTLATLLRSGVDIVASLEIASKVINNMPAEKIVDEIRIKIMEGSNLSKEMSQYPMFPRMTVRMSAIGEKSGKIDEMLEKIAEYYVDEVDATIEGLSSIIEPVLIVLLGVLVGGFVIAMYLPVFKMAMAMMGTG